MRRHLLGLFALLFFLTAGVMSWWQPVGGVQRPVMISVSLRLGTMLAAIWLAYPQLESLAHRISRTALGVGLATLAVLVLRPRAALWIIPLLGLLACLTWLRRFLSTPPRRP